MSEEPKVPSRGRRLATVAASIVTGALLFAAGLAGGWVAASQKSAPVESHAGDGGHEGHAHAARAPALSPKTLANLGVEVGELTPSEFVRTRDVPAVVTSRPGSLVPASALVAGVIEEVLVVEGQRVAAGAPVARVRRDAFPRVALVLSDAVLKPLNEEFHGAIAELRSSSQSLAIAREELARIRGVLSRAENSLPTKVEIDLRNDERRSLRSLENARLEAERHGLTAIEIAAIEAGGTSATDLPPVERVLARNGLWSEEASSVLAALPEGVRGKPYAIAVVAELVGSRALTPQLADTVRTRPDVAAAFLDVAGLIQQGASVASIVALAEAGALESVFTVRAPKGAPDWDVEAVRARAGDRVDAGTTVAECRDLSQVQLELAAAGADLAAISVALAARETLTAEPLIAGAGPMLQGLSLLRIEADGGHGDRGAAIVSVANKPLASTQVGEREFRSWAVRPALRYLVRIPVARLANKFVLPADAVAAQGPDTVLLLEDGAGFRPVAVRVEHRDARVVVVANDGAVFPGDRAVLRGAYSVMLAIQAAAGGGVDPHAGHNH